MSEINQPHLSAAEQEILARANEPSFDVTGRANYGTERWETMKAVALDKDLSAARQLRMSARYVQAKAAFWAAVAFAVAVLTVLAAVVTAVVVGR